MTNKKDLLSFCGIYCGDCLGNTGVIAEAAEDFKTVLNKYQFEKTAESVFHKQIEDFNRFYETLKFMTSLKCPKPCRERKNLDISCSIRACCQEKGYFACYECRDFENCEKQISLMKGLHSHALRQNLKAIKKIGLEKWIRSGKRHH